MRDESQAASNILPSPITMIASRALVNATLILFALSMWPQVLSGLERVVLKMTISASPPWLESMVSMRISPSSHSASQRWRIP